MKSSVSLERRLAHSLLRCASWLLPASRHEWAPAMRAELDRLDEDRDALKWAIGCVLAGFKERVRAWASMDLRVPGWILVPEMLLCFLPLTVGWLDALFGDSGVVRLNREVIETHFLHTPAGVFALLTMGAGAALGTLGPLGLVSAFRWVATHRPLTSRVLRTALVVGPTLYGVLILVSRLAIGGTQSLHFDASDSFDFWSGILLLSALPALGAAHLLHLAGPNRTGKLTNG